MTRKIVWGLVFVVSLYLGALLFLSVNQRALQYVPGQEAIDIADTPLAGKAALVGIGNSSVGVRGWYAPPKDGRPTIVYFKGNEGSISHQARRFVDMVDAGFGFIGFDYRGYPMSPGEISQDNILADALEVFDWAEAKGGPLVIWGRSLGSGPATYVAAKRAADALVLETPFLSAVEVAGERYPLLPVGALMKDQYPVSDWIGDVSEPVMVAHGDNDWVIGVHHGQELFAMAENGRDLFIVAGGAHGDLWDHGLWARARTFVESVVPPAVD